jgi:hypothetical protein
MGVYISHSQVAARITWEEVHAIFDDQQDGGWQNNLDQFIEEAESVIEQTVAKTYGEDGLNWLRTQGTAAPPSIRRLCLDEFEWRMGTRHPGYTNAALWAEKRRWINEDLKALRLRDVELDTEGDPEPAVNEGGIVESGDPNDTDPKEKVFLDGMGTFWSPPTET